MKINGLRFFSLPSNGFILKPSSTFSFFGVVCGLVGTLHDNILFFLIFITEMVYILSFFYYLIFWESCATLYFYDCPIVFTFQDMNNNFHNNRTKLFRRKTY